MRGRVRHMHLVTVARQLEVGVVSWGWGRAGRKKDDWRRERG